jgi:hypothetical protein
MHTYMYTYMHACMHTCMHACIYMHTHPYVWLGGGLSEGLCRGRVARLRGDGITYFQFSLYTYIYIINFFCGGRGRSCLDRRVARCSAGGSGWLGGGWLGLARRRVARVGFLTNTQLPCTFNFSREVTLLSACFGLAGFRLAVGLLWPF